MADLELIYRIEKMVIVHSKLLVYQRILGWLPGSLMDINGDYWWLVLNDYSGDGYTLVNNQNDLCNITMFRTTHYFDGHFQ